MSLEQEARFSQKIKRPWKSYPQAFWPWTSLWVLAGILAVISWEPMALVTLVSLPFWVLAALGLLKLSDSMLLGLVSSTSSTEIGQDNLELTQNDSSSPSQTTESRLSTPSGESASQEQSDS